MKKFYYLIMLCLMTGAAAAQDVTICKDANYTIPSITDASAGVDNYRWFENNKLIPGAEDNAYTIAAGSRAPGTYTYVRQAHSQECDLWQSSNVYTVRMVETCQKPGETATMQDFAPISYTTNSTWVLTDDRNAQTYTVRYLADGRFWMANDLKYPAACNKTTFSGATATGALGSNVEGFYGDCRNSPHSSEGYFYDWMFVMQDERAYKGSSWDPGCTGNPGGKAACRGICPEGWHVPTSGNANSEVVILFNTLCGTQRTDISCLTNNTTFNLSQYGWVRGDNSIYYDGAYTVIHPSNPCSDQLNYTWGGRPGLVSYNFQNEKSHGTVVRCVRN